MEMNNLSLMMCLALLVQIGILGVGMYTVYLLIKALRIYIRKNQD